MWEDKPNPIATEITYDDFEISKSESGWKLGKNEILAVAGLVLFFAGAGTAWLSDVGLWMIAAGILVVAFAANVRIISPLAASALGLYVTVTACVLAFYLLGDITDIGVDWLDRVSWLFRVVGLTIALAIFAFLWFVVRERRRVYSELPSAHPPSDLPAAAVSELVDRDEGRRTPFTIVMEMLRKGALEITSEGIDNVYLETYRLRGRSGGRYEWEQTVVDALPQEPMTRHAILNRLNEPELGVRRQIHEYLRHRGLLHDERSIRTQNNWSAIHAVHGVVLMGVGLTLWIVRLEPAWWVGLGMIGAAYVGAMWIAYRQNAELSEFTDDGRVETMRWRGFGTRLESSAFDEAREAGFDPTNSLMPYAAALNRAHLWKQESTQPEASQKRPSGLGESIAESSRGDRVSTDIGFFAGYYAGSYTYPGEEGGNPILDVSDFSAVFGGGDSGGGADVGGGGFGGGGGDGGDFGIGF